MGSVVPGGERFGARLQGQRHPQTVQSVGVGQHLDQSRHERGQAAPRTADRAPAGTSPQPVGEGGEVTGILGVHHREGQRGRHVGARRRWSVVGGRGPGGARGELGTGRCNALVHRVEPRGVILEHPGAGAERIEELDRTEHLEAVARDELLGPLRAHRCGRGPIAPVMIVVARMTSAGGELGARGRGVRRHRGPPYRTRCRDGLGRDGGVGYHYRSPRTRRSRWAGDPPDPPAHASSDFPATDTSRHRRPPTGSSKNHGRRV